MKAEFSQTWPGASDELGEKYLNQQTVALEHNKEPLFLAITSTRRVTGGFRFELAGNSKEIVIITTDDTSDDVSIEIFTRE